MPGCQEIQKVFIQKSGDEEKDAQFLSVTDEF
jgi:hypothetical protein